MGEKYGYTRVSDDGQHPERQIEAIKRYAPSIPEENIFVEKVSGKKGVNDRTEYGVLRRVLRAGDELIIDSLDRLGRQKLNTPPETVPLDRTNGAARPLKWCMVTADMVH